MVTYTTDITAKIIKYNELMCKNENSTRFMKKLYREIREQCLTEAYFSKYIKAKVTEEDMPDFIIYLDDKLPGIIGSYDPERDPSFNTLYRKSLDYRARNYLDTKRRKEKREMVHMKYFIPFEEEITRSNIKNPFDEVLDRLEESYSKKNFEAKACSDRTVLKRLKYVMANKSSLRKNFFIFLSSRLPFIPMDMIERICKELNFDLSEVKAIEKFLSKTTEKTERNICEVRDTLERFNALVHVSEAELYHYGDSCSEKEREKLYRNIDFQKSNRKSAEERLEATAACVRNPVLAKMLNIPLSTVSASISKAKSMLNSLIEETQNEDYCSPATDDLPNTVCRKPVVLKPFKPSEVFDISFC